MSLQHRINELSNRHRDLDHKIQTSQKQPAADQVELTRLKREKLRLKEQILNLET